MYIGTNENADPSIDEWLEWQAYHPIKGKAAKFRNDDDTPEKEINDGNDE